jgi:hypothetical protein
MTPREFLDQVAELIADERDEEALALAERWGPEVLPRLTQDEFFRLCGMMEGAQLAVDLVEAERAHQQSTGGSVHVHRRPA